MGKQKKNKGLGAFHKEMGKKGLTYAEAQIKESCEMVGRIRAPRDADGEVYMKVSARNLLKKTIQP